MAKFRIEKAHLEKLSGMEGYADFLTFMEDKLSAREDRGNHFTYLTKSDKGPLNISLLPNDDKKIIEVIKALNALGSSILSVDVNGKVTFIPSEINSKSKLEGMEARSSNYANIGDLSVKKKPSPPPARQKINNQRPAPPPPPRVFGVQLAASLGLEPNTIPADADNYVIPAGSPLIKDELTKASLITKLTAAGFVFSPIASDNGELIVFKDQLALTKFYRQDVVLQQDAILPPPPKKIELTEEQKKEQERLSDRIGSLERFIDGYQYIIDANTNTPEEERNKATVLYQRYFSLFDSYFDDILSGKLGITASVAQLEKIEKFKAQSALIGAAPTTREDNLADRSIVSAEMDRNTTFIQSKLDRVNNSSIITFGLAASCTSVHEVAQLALDYTKEDIAKLNEKLNGVYKEPSNDREQALIALAKCQERQVVFTAYLNNQSRVSDLKPADAEKLRIALNGQSSRFKALSSINKGADKALFEARGAQLSIYDDIVRSYVNKDKFDQTAEALYGENSQAFLKAAKKLRNAPNIDTSRQMMKELIGFDSNDLGKQEANNRINGQFNLNSAIYTKYGPIYSEHSTNFYSLVDRGCDLFAKTFSKVEAQQVDLQLAEIKTRAYQLAAAELVSQLKIEGVSITAATGGNFFGGGWGYDEFIKETFKDRTGAAALSTTEEIQTLISNYKVRFTELFVAKQKELVDLKPEHTYEAQSARLSASKKDVKVLARRQKSVPNLPVDERRPTPLRAKSDPNVQVQPAKMSDKEIQALAEKNPVMFRLALLEQAQDFKDHGPALRVGSKTKGLTGYGSEELKEVINNLPAQYNPATFGNQNPGRAWQETSIKINKAVTALVNYKPAEFAKSLTSPKERIKLYNKMTPEQFAEMCKFSTTPEALNQIISDFSFDQPAIDHGIKIGLLVGLIKLKDTILTKEQASTLLQLLAPESNLNFIKVNDDLQLGLMPFVQQLITLSEQSEKFLPLLEPAAQLECLIQMVTHCVKHNLAIDKLTPAIIDGLDENIKSDIISILHLDSKPGPLVSDAVVGHILTNIDYFIAPVTRTGKIDVSARAKEQIELIDSLTARGQAKVFTPAQINLLSTETIINLVRQDPLRQSHTRNFLTGLEKEAQSRFITRLLATNSPSIANILTELVIQRLSPVALQPLLTNNAQLDYQAQASLINQAHAHNLDLNGMITGLKPEAIKTLLSSSPKMGEIYNKLRADKKTELREKFFQNNIYPTYPSPDQAKIFTDIILDSTTDEIPLINDSFFRALKNTSIVIQTLLNDAKIIQFTNNLSDNAQLAFMSSISLTKQMGLCPATIITALKPAAIKLIIAKKELGNLYFRELGIEAKKALIDQSIKQGAGSWGDIIPAHAINSLDPAIMDHLLKAENAPIIAGLSAAAQVNFLKNALDTDKLWHYTDQAAGKFVYDLAPAVIQGLKPEAVAALLKLENAKIFYDSLSPKAKTAFRAQIINIGNNAHSSETNILLGVNTALVAQIILDGNANDHKEITPKFFRNFADSTIIKRRGLNAENVSVETEVQVVKNDLVYQIFSTPTPAPKQITSFIEQLTTAGSKSALAEFVTQDVVNAMPIATITSIGERAVAADAVMVNINKPAIKVFLESAVVSASADNPLAKSIQFYQAQARAIQAMPNANEVIVPAPVETRTVINATEFALLFMKNKDFRREAVSIIEKAHTDKSWYKKDVIKNVPLKMHFDKLKEPYLALKSLQEQINTAKQEGLDPTDLQTNYNQEEKKFVVLCKAVLDAAPDLKTKITPLADKILLKPQAAKGEDITPNSKAQEDVLQAMHAVLRGEKTSTGIRNPQIATAVRDKNLSL